MENYHSSNSVEKMKKISKIAEGKNLETKG